MQFFGEDPAEHELSGIDLIYLRKRAADLQKAQTTYEKTTVTDKRTGNKIAEKKSIDIKSTTSGQTTHSVVKTESSSDSIKQTINTKAVEVDLDRHDHVSEVVAQKVHVDLHNVKSSDELEVKETIQIADTPIESKELISKFEHPFHEHHHHHHHHLEHHSAGKKSHHHTKHMHEHESDTHKSHHEHHHDGYDHHDLEEYEEYETDSDDEDFESAYIRSVVKHHGEECGCKYCSKSKYQHMKMKHAMAKKSHHHSQQHESDTHFHASQTGTQQTVFGTSGFNPMMMSGVKDKHGQTTHEHTSHEHGHHEKPKPETTQPPIDSLEAEYGKLTSLITNYLKDVGGLSADRIAFYKLKLENAKRQLDFYWSRYKDTEQLPEQKEKARQGLMSMRSYLPKLFFQIDGELIHEKTQ